MNRTTPGVICFTRLSNMVEVEVFVVRAVLFYFFLLFVWMLMNRIMVSRHLHVNVYRISVFDQQHAERPEYVVIEEGLGMTSRAEKTTQPGGLNPWTYSGCSKFPFLTRNMPNCWARQRTLPTNPIRKKKLGSP